MKVSIIIPVYKSQDINRCLDSLLSQSYRNIEIFCIGDKVEDNSHAIVKSYVQQYPNIIQFYLQDGRGQGGARNLGLSLVKGSYIMFVDADDYVEHTIIQTLVEAMNETNADFVCCSFDRISTSGKVYSKEMRSVGRKVFQVTPNNVTLLAFVFPAPWGKLFRREAIENLWFPENPISAYEDCVFFLSLIPQIKIYTILPQILYHYVVHEQSAVTNATLEKSSIFRNDLQKLKLQFDKEGILKEYGPLLDLAAFIHVGIGDVHRIANNPDIQLSKFIIEAKVFLDIVFPSWRYISYAHGGKITIRSLALYISKWLYLCNSFIVFVRIYNLMIKKFHIDIKW